MSNKGISFTLIFILFILQQQPVVLLSFDVEEFDLPLEYNQPIGLPEQLAIGKQGLDALIPLLQQHNLTTTLFTTAQFANYYSTTVQELSVVHEIASHTYYHSNFEEAHLQQSRLALESICGKPVTGLRMPRLRNVTEAAVIAAGYGYDSSINPTYLPGRYNNWHLPRTPYQNAGLLRVPVAVTPNLRIPLFWLAFKNMPYFLYKQLLLQTLRKDGYVCLYFHPWEFTDLEKYQIPNFTKRSCGNALLHKLDLLVTDLKKEATFATMQAFTQTHCATLL